MKLITFQWKQNKWDQNIETSLDSPNTLVLVFGSASLRERIDIFSELRSFFPQSILMGCSTAGEIYNSEVFDNSLSVGVARFETCRLKSVTMAIESVGESYSIGRESTKLLLQEDLKAIFVLSEGININGTKLVQGINSIISPGTIIFGGLAGDGSDFKNTWVIKNGKPFSNHVSMVGIYGDRIEIGVGSEGGWNAFGPDRKITKSNDNVLYELDGQPALGLYKLYLGKDSEMLPGSALLFPILLKSEFMDTSGIVRTVLSVDEKKQAMTFAGDMPEGSIVQLMNASSDNLIMGAKQAAVQAAGCKKWENDSPVLSIAISCVGRRLVLGENVEDETEAVFESLPPTTRQIGFYSYGEISPNRLNKCDLHNQTMTLITFKETV
ncbi:MAG: FIST N-terminal domain-containing protein [Desulfobacula sp.]|jgi:hypothetical protein